jgi:hypothetical protein
MTTARGGGAESAVASRIGTSAADRARCRQRRLLARILRLVAPSTFVSDDRFPAGMVAALLHPSESWRMVRVTKFELRQLQLYRNALNEQFRARHVPIAQPINPASRTRISSNRGTSPALAIKIGAWYITTMLPAAPLAFSLVVDHDAEPGSYNG